MNGHEIGSLACKVLGIFFIVQGINTLASIISFIASTPSLNGNERLLNICFALIYIVFGVLLWFLSDKISEMMNTGKRNADNKSVIEIGDIQRVSFSVLGLYFMGSSLPKLVSNLINMHYLINDPNSTTRLILGLGGMLTQFIIGLGIFLGSQGLVNFLKVMRSAGIRKENDSE
ncbi:hypothetical protein [Desulfitobacterium metallireducens]|uniref:Uncharacterized protein n=1 Tax=Desulfitobacterium metallireducens DSM 15288 TaxID=871968 RepID=W0EGT8_9FIRM|nr:hypothetical protein [Desulfitobacterium metallireducens]AHF08419.1 hypothetical protein DESME_02310 [Desulfitobacterium metallireducens DSM 15288]